MIVGVYDFIMWFYECYMSLRCCDLLVIVWGIVVEIGFGIGVNFSYFGVIEGWVGIELG